MNNWITYLIYYLEIGVVVYLFGALYYLPEQIKSIKSSKSSCYRLHYENRRTGKIYERDTNWKFGLAFVIIIKYLFWPLTVISRIKRLIVYIKTGELT